MDETKQVVFIGAGSAGIGPLVYAKGAGRLPGYLKRPIAIIEKSSQFGSGSFGDYLINTNSKSELFLECLQGSRAEHFPRAIGSAAFRILSGQRHLPGAMRTVGELLEEIGKDVADTIYRSGTSSIMTRTAATKITTNIDGTFSVDIASENGASRIHAHNLVLATGGSALRMPHALKRLVSICSRRARSDLLMLHSGDLLGAHGYKMAIEELKKRRGCRALIIGGGDSAFSAAWLLLQSTELEFGERGLTVAYRSTPKVCFDSAERALECGYSEFAKDDICPQTGIVFRIGGLRHDAKELYLNITAGREPRVCLKQLDDGLAALAAEDLSDVGVVIFATGYLPTEVPIFDDSARPIPLLGTFTGKYVDGQGRVIRANGEVFKHMYAIGLCSGYLPMEGGFGGESSFDGLANSVALCQTSVGKMIFDQLEQE